MTPPERDAAILEHLRRYHLTTPEILHRLFFPGVGLNAVRKVTSRLSRERRISPARLFEQRKYFVLTPREAEHLGEHRSIGRKFEYQGLVNAYGILSFCAANGVKKFTPREFAEKFPELVIPGVRSGNYYLEPEETPEGRKFRLAFIHVDYGITPNALVKKVRKIISRAFTLPAFAKLLQGGHFIVTVVTPTETKAAEIKIALSTEPPTPVRFRIEPVSELAELLTHRGRLKDARLRKPKQAEDQTQAAAPSPAAEPPATGPTLEHSEARSPVSKEAEASS
jgi:hypothetical protein